MDILLIIVGISAKKILDYSEQFWRKYNNNRKFSTIVIDSAHEETMEVLKYIDEIIYNFHNYITLPNIIFNNYICLDSCY